MSGWGVIAVMKKTGCGLMELPGSTTTGFRASLITSGEYNLIYPSILISQAIGTTTLHMKRSHFYVLTKVCQIIKYPITLYVSISNILTILLVLFYFQLASPGGDLSMVIVTSLFLRRNLGKPLKLIVAMSHLRIQMATWLLQEMMLPICSFQH